MGNRFLQASSTSLSQRAVQAYLNSDDPDVLKWYAYMEGAVNLTFDDIDKLTIPELSVMVYCTNERIKNQTQVEAGRMISG